MDNPTNTKDIASCIEFGEKITTRLRDQIETVTDFTGPIDSRRTRRTYPMGYIKVLVFSLDIVNGEIAMLKASTCEVNTTLAQAQTESTSPDLQNKF
jgi:hypothetical protein